MTTVLLYLSQKLTYLSWPTCASCTNTDPQSSPLQRGKTTDARDFADPPSKQNVCPPFILFICSPHSPKTIKAIAPPRGTRIHIALIGFAKAVTDHRIGWTGESVGYGVHLRCLGGDRAFDVAYYAGLIRLLCQIRSKHVGRAEWLFKSLLASSRFWDFINQFSSNCKACLKNKIKNTRIK